MIDGIHFLLTYSCTYECDHCFLHGSPRAQGTFTVEQLRAVFEQIQRLGSVEDVYFEGGEPFLYYPLLLEGLRLAAGLGLRAGIVSNAYWANSVKDAELWLKPIRDIGIADLSVSDDAFHSSSPVSPARRAVAAAANLGIPHDTIRIAAPAAAAAPDDSPGKGAPVTGGNVLFKGRAAEKLTAGLPRRPVRELTSCPHEDLETPGRVHVDCFGHVHLCQGLSMGNLWETPLADLVRAYNARQHPICGPLLAGGPAALAETYSVELPDGFADECHCCYTVRKALLDRFPALLAPRQMYGFS